MRIATIMVFGVSALLAGCHGDSSGITGRQQRGRFAGIGVYEAGRLWQHMTAQDPQDPAVAKLADDEHIIVVVDSRTGEVRQCGDHSGYCVAMNPWAGPRPTSLPARLSKHAADLDAADKAGATDHPALAK